MKLCDICNQSSDRSYVITLTDKDSRVEIKGCKPCTDELWNRINGIENRDKMSNEKELSLLGLNIEDFEVRNLR